MHTQKDEFLTRDFIRQITKFLAEGETKLDSKVLQLYNHADFTDNDAMEAIPFMVPQLPPSTLPFCGIIDVSYQIQVSTIRIVFGIGMPTK